VTQKQTKKKEQKQNRKKKRKTRKRKKGEVGKNNKTEGPKKEEVTRNQTNMKQKFSSGETETCGGSDPFFSYLLIL